MSVTSDVIRDLWVLQEAGEASADSRRLVEEFLAQHPQLAAELEREVRSPGPRAHDLPPNHEAKTFSLMKRRLDRRSPLRLVALAFTGLAIARLIEHSTFTESPVEVIGLAIAAGVTWFAYGWHTRYLQRRAVFGAADRSARR